MFQKDLGLLMTATRSQKLRQAISHIAGVPRVSVCFASDLQSMSEQRLDLAVVDGRNAWFASVHHDRVSQAVHRVTGEWVIVPHAGARGCQSLAEQRNCSRSIAFG